MKTNRKPLAALAVLAIALLAGGNIRAAESGKPPDALSDDALKATSERIRQTGQKIQSDIQQALRKARDQRDT